MAASSIRALAAVEGVRAGASRQACWRAALGLGGWGELRVMRRGGSLPATSDGGRGRGRGSPIATFLVFLGGRAQQINGGRWVGWSTARQQRPEEARVGEARHR